MAQQRAKSLETLHTRVDELLSSLEKIADGSKKAGFLVSSLVERVSKLEQTTTDIREKFNELEQKLELHCSSCAKCNGELKELIKIVSELKGVVAQLNQRLSNLEFHQQDVTKTTYTTTGKVAGISAVVSTVLYGIVEFLRWVTK